MSRADVDARAAELRRSVAAMQLQRGQRQQEGHGPGDAGLARPRGAGKASGVFVW